MAINLIGHVKIEKFNDPNCEPYDRYAFDIHKRATEMLYRWSDGILFLQRKTIVIQEDAGFNKKTKRAVEDCGNDPYLYTQSRPSHPGGGNGADWRNLPYEIDLSYESFTKALGGGK